MSIVDAITDIAARLRQAKYPNEQAISQGVVLRLLGELGWDTWDTSIVWPEYQTGEWRADFALCHPPSKPAVFIEVKQPGKAEDAVRQALEYAFHTGGVPFTVLTDGRTWSFYLPMEQGSYEDRRVYKLDLFEQSADQAAATLTRYLARSAVETGESLETARKEYRSRSRRSQARDAISSSWQELVEKGDEQLVELLASTVESKVGVRPDVDDVAEFLAGLGRVAKGQGARTSPTVTPSSIKPQNTLQQRGGGEQTRAGKLVVLGKTYQYNNANEAMVLVLKLLADADASFLEKCSQHPDAQGRKRRYIARSAEELYPDRPDLREYRRELPGGWLVSTNLNNILKKTIIRLAAEVAGLEFGKDIVVDL